MFILVGDSGNLLALSYDQFGCHVVQKLIDTGGEKAKVSLKARTKDLLIQLALMHACWIDARHLRDY